MSNYPFVCNSMISKNYYYYYVRFEMKFLESIVKDANHISISEAS